MTAAGAGAPGSVGSSNSLRHKQIRHLVPPGTIQNQRYVARRVQALAFDFLALQFMVLYFLHRQTGDLNEHQTRVA